KETYVETCKEESKLKKFFKKLFKRKEKEYKVEENFWSWDTIDIESFCLTSIKKNYEISLN
ncbi:30823_t:CDS:1, partial [Gigaspora margarita]